MLLVSTYELGHQPLHVASPAALLRRRGHEVRAVDLAVEPWDPDAVRWADAVAFSVPMHTAMRLAVEAAGAVRRMQPDLPVCLYGLYAPVGRDATAGRVADRLIAGEYETALAAWVDDLAAHRPADGQLVHLGRGRFGLPARDLLPALDRYARLRVDGEERLAGYVETSHGCAHRCRHCPIPPVYDGRIRIVGHDAVLADVEQLVALGARHITFGDPDFLNGVHHSLRVVRTVHERFPDVTFDCTTKVELILRHRHVWPELAGAGCLFVVSAFETVDDTTLRRLDKGHTVADEVEALELLRGQGIEVRPSFLPFTPWTTTAGMVDLLDFVADHGLVASVDPVQYAIRLLLPDGSLLLDHPDLAPHLDGYDPAQLSWRWKAADPAVDELQAELATLLEVRLATGEPVAATYLAVARVVRAAAGVGGEPAVPADAFVREPPRLTESWFCCAEPTGAQLGAVTADR